MGHVERGGGYTPQPFQEKFDAGVQGGNTSGGESRKKRKARAKRFLAERDKPAKKKHENQPPSDKKTTGNYFSGFGGHGPGLPDSHFEEEKRIRDQLIEEERIDDQLLQGNSDQSDDPPGPNKSLAK